MGAESLNVEGMTVRERERGNTVRRKDMTE